MSWIFGIIGNYNTRDTDVFKTIHTKPLHLILSKKHYIATGGINETCFCKYSVDKLNSSSKGWIVCGVGIYNKDHNFSFLTNAEWGILIKQFPDKINELDGHFVAVKWDNKNAYCYTDQLGMRNLYLTQMENYSAFSTRLDWLAKLNNKCQINLQTMASQSLLINQLSQQSILTNTIRLGQGGSAKINSKSVSYKNKPWNFKKATSEDFISSLRKLSLFPLQSGHSLSLALSGGFDSRVILSILLASEYKDWSIHSLHHPDNPDRIIAQSLTKDLKISHVFIEDHIPDKSETVKLLQEYIGHTMATHAASAFIGLQFYDTLSKQNKIVIDGGLGEIARRRYLNRLKYSAKRLILNKDIKNLHLHLAMRRAHIFNRDTIKIMEQSIQEEILGLIGSMPSPSHLDMNNWLDLMAIRTRFPNLAGFEQSRVDHKIVTFMPFAQPSFLNTLFNTSVNDRVNGKIFRKIIHQNSSGLKNLPLVKDGIIYPYSLPTIPATIYMKLKKRLGYVFNEQMPILFLDHISEYILDIVHSDVVKNNDFYDYEKIIKMVDGYYTGQNNLVHQIDWWLAFEIWRQNVNSIN